MCTTVSDQQKTSVPWAIRPRRRSANSLAHTWASTPTGRIIIASNVPIRTCRPSRSTLPTTRSATPRQSAVAPYRKAIRPSPNPPRLSTLVNITRIATKSTPVMTSEEKVRTTNDVR